MRFFPDYRRSQATRNKVGDWLVSFLPGVMISKTRTSLISWGSHPNTYVRKEWVVIERLSGNFTISTKRRAFRVGRNGHGLPDPKRFLGVFYFA